MWVKAPITICQHKQYVSTYEYVYMCAYIYVYMCAYIIYIYT